MATEKQITNHQLGIALASLIEKQERNQKNALQEQVKIIEQMNSLKFSLTETYQSFKCLKINVDTNGLDIINSSIKTTSKEAVDRIDKSLKKILISPYIFGMFALLTLSAVLSVWFSLSKVIDLNSQVNEMKRYTNHVTEYYKQHPKEWEKVRKWKK